MKVLKSNLLAQLNAQSAHLLCACFSFHLEKMRSLRGFKVITTAFYIAILVISPTQQWLEICKDSSIYTMSAKDCPAGVLFREPMSWKDCVVPNTENGDRDHISNVCDADQDVAASNMIQFVDVGVDDSDGPSGGDSYSSCKPDRCTGELVAINSGNTMHGSADDQSVEIAHENNEPDMPDVQNQTLRLFMYLTGHLIDENDGGPHFRLIQLLKMSYNVTAKYVKLPFLKPVFFEELSRSFLFLLRESDTGPIKDIRKDVFSRLMASLEECQSIADSENTMVYTGKVCQTTAKIRNFAKANLRGVGNVTARYQPDPESFVWGKYDFVLDAAWLIMNFIHGHCYRVFRKNVNDHHLYEYAIERLWTKELLYRWRNPPKLKYEVYWDHVFRSNVKVSMRNLDAMVFSVYYDNPFVMRVRRPWIKQEEAGEPPAPESRRRRKRQATVQAWCMQNAEDKNDKLEELRKMCPSAAPP